MRCLYLLSLLIFPHILYANPDHVLTTIQIQESLEQEIENDLMVVRMQIQVTHPNTQKVAEQINTAMQWAINLVKDESAVQTQTVGYSTYPNYRDKKIQSWSGQQSLQLTSKDFDLLTMLIGKLQAKLTISNITFSVSNESYKQAEHIAIDQAILAFKEKVDVVVRAMQAKESHIKDMAISNNRQPNPQPFLRQGKLSIAESSSAPALLAGTNTLRINITGQIEILK